MNASETLTALMDKARSLTGLTKALLFSLVPRIGGACYVA